MPLSNIFNQLVLGSLSCPGHKQKHRQAEDCRAAFYCSSKSATPGRRQPGRKRTMPPPRRRAALAVVVAVVLLIVAAAAHAPGDGTAGECVDDEGAVARRELGGNGYIGYAAMSAGNVPCSYRGASYYNCRPSGAANPYSRGCSAITQCRG